MMMIVLLLNGHPRSGKDTFIEIARDDYKVYQHSTIDKCCQFAVGMGWDGLKTPESRAMLSELKKFYTKHFDGPFIDVINAILLADSKDYYDFFITVSREGKEIERIKQKCKELDISFLYIMIDRDNKKDFGNDSDNNILDGCAPDCIVDNKGDIADYISSVQHLLWILKNGKLQF